MEQLLNLDLVEQLLYQDLVEQLLNLDLVEQLLNLAVVEQLLNLAVGEQLLNLDCILCRVLVYDHLSLVDCTDCSLVSSTEVWDGSSTSSWTTFPPTFNPAIDVLEIDNKYIVALTETIQAVGRDNGWTLDAS